MIIYLPEHPRSFPSFNMTDYDSDLSYTFDETMNLSPRRAIHPVIYEDKESTVRRFQPGHEPPKSSRPLSDRLNTVPLKTRLFFADVKNQSNRLSVVSNGDSMKRASAADSSKDNARDTNRKSSSTTGTRQSTGNRAQQYNTSAVDTTINTGVFNVTGQSGSSSSSDGRRPKSGLPLSSVDYTTTTSSSSAANETGNTTDDSIKKHESYIRNSQRYSTGIFKEFSDSSIIDEHWNDPDLSNGPIAEESRETSDNSLHQTKLASESNRASLQTQSTTSTTDITDTRLISPDDMDESIADETADLITNDDLSQAMSPRGLRQKVLMKEYPIRTQRPERAQVSSSQISPAQTPRAAPPPPASAEPAHSAMVVDNGMAAPKFPYTYNLSNESSASSIHNNTILSPVTQVSSASVDTSDNYLSANESTDVATFEEVGELGTVMGTAKKPTISFRKATPGTSHLLVSKEELTPQNGVAGTPLPGHLQMRSAKVGMDQRDIDNRTQVGTEAAISKPQSKMEYSGTSSGPTTLQSGSAPSSSSYSHDIEKGRLSSSSTGTYCPDSTALLLVILSVVVPPFWVLISIGYLDDKLGTVRKPYKIAGAVLAILFAIGAIVGIAVGFALGLS